MGQEPSKVIGKRSPRWGVWIKMLIPCKSGVPYLFRLRIIQTPWFGVYLHDIFEPDGQDPHDHPWSFVSIVLRGEYEERVFVDPVSQPYFFIKKRHRRFSVHFMNIRHAHHITYALPGLKTLILVGPRHRDWGFYRNGSFIPWQGYEEKYPTMHVQRTTS